MLASGDLKKTEVHDVSELARFAEYAQRFARGESACLAIAACRGWVFATDETKDKRLKKEIEAPKVRIINPPGLILKAIQNGELSISEADAIKAELEKNTQSTFYNRGECMAKSYGGCRTPGLDNPGMGSQCSWGL